MHHHYPWLHWMLTHPRLGIGIVVVALAAIRGACTGWMASVRDEQLYRARNARRIN